MIFFILIVFFPPNFGREILCLLQIIFLSLALAKFQVFSTLYASSSRRKISIRKFAMSVSNFFMYILCTITLK